MRLEQTDNRTPRRLVRLFRAAVFSLLLGSGVVFGQTITFDSSAANGLEGVTSVSIGVTTLGYTTEFPVTVILSDAGSIASGGGVDYSVSTGVLTFYTNTTQTINITINSESLYENDETVRLDLLAESAGNITPEATYIYTINNDDAKPLIKFIAATRNGSEGTTSPINIEVTLTTLSGLDATVDYVDAATGSAYPSGVDYTLNSGTATINAGAWTTSIPVTIVDDGLAEYGETIDITISNAGNSTLTGPTALTYTINDNDTDPTVQFVDPTTSNSETITAPVVQVTLSAISGKNVTVNFAATGTATGSGTDYTLAASPLTISAGDLTEDISITVVDDALDEYAETIVLTLSSPTNATLGAQTSHTYTIQDEDPTPTVGFSTPTANGDENSTPVSFEVALSAVSGRDVSVDYDVVGGTAGGSGVDYTLASGTATITAGNPNTTFTATINDDVLDEDNETIIIDLSNLINGDPGANQTHTYTIDDNDLLPDIQFSNTTSSAGEGSGTANLELVLSTVSGRDATVSYSVTGGDATGGGTDFTLNAGTATITAGQTTTNIAVGIAEEALHEADETVIVTIAGPGNADLGGNTAHTLTIDDNDAEPTVGFTDASSSGGEGTASPTFELTISAISGLDVTVEYSAGGGDATGGGGDYTLNSGTATINKGLLTTTLPTVPMDIVEDALYEADESFTITLSNAAGASIAGNTTHTYTITNNDATPTVEFSSGSSTGAENVSAVNFAVNIPVASGLDVSVDYTISGTATSGTDYILDDGTATITAGNTSVNVSATIVEDPIDENDETIILTLSNPTNALVGTTDPVHTYTITDNDPQPDVAFAAASSSGSENVTLVTLQVTLSALSGLDVIFDYALSGGTATGGGTDFTFTGASDTIFAGTLTTNIPLTVVDDIYDEPITETILVNISNPTNATLGGITTHTYTINDDDPPPTIQFATISSSGNESVSPADLLIELTPPSQLLVSVDYTITGGTATGGGVDYTLADGTLNISAGVSVANISPLITDDNVVGLDETIEVTLTALSAVNASIGANDVHTYTILNDDFPPVAFTVGTVTATGGTVNTGYWNASNTGLDVTVPVDNSATLDGGTIQLRGIIGADTTSVGGAYAIVGGDLGASVTISLAAAQLEAITGFAEGATVEISAVITDAYGNSTTGTVSASTVDVDQTAPAAFAVGQVNTIGGTIITGYWNAANSGIEIVVPLASDATLDGGSVQLRAEADGSWEDLGVPDTIQAGEITIGSVTISVSATEAAATGVEELAGFSAGDVVTINALITDAAGNNITGTASITTLVIDQAVPSAAVSYSDTLAKEGDTVVVSVTFDEPAVATPQIGLAYADNTKLATDMTATGDAAIWTHDVVVLAGNDGYMTVSVTGADAAGNALAPDSLTNAAALLVDNTAPGYVLSYIDSLVKAADVTTITARFIEPVQATPTISIDFAGTGADISAAATLMAANDSIWTYQLTTPTGNDGTATVTIAALDYVGNAAVVVTGDDALVVDNTQPNITVAAPDSGGYERTTAVTYTLDETVISGQVTWTKEGIPATQHVQQLITAELAIGTHSDTLVNAPVLVQGVVYTLQFLVFDEAGNPDTAIVQSVMYDTLVPDVSGAKVLDSLGTEFIDSTLSTTELSGQFLNFTDDASGIASYEYAIGSTQGDTDVVSWTSTGDTTTFTATGLSLDLKAWYWLMGRATDRAGNVSDTVIADGVRIISRPAPTIAVVQNSALPAYVQIFITDTLGMANSFTIEADNETIIDTSRIDTFTYVANHRLEAAGTLVVEVTGHSAAGDSTITDSIAIALAKRDQSWWARSLDQRFLVQGSVASVKNDQFLTVVGSRNFLSREQGQGSYRLAYSGLEFAVPVKVLMQPSQQDPLLAKGKKGQAVYRLLRGGGWEELPTVDEGNMVVAWSKRAGNFRLGPRTIFVPQTTSLHHNYPNPFNPSTRIVFDLGFLEGPEQRASVIIYNLLGQEVRTLHNGLTRAGRYELVWQGIDQRGAAVASGVYFVRLLTGTGHLEVKKMLLVR